MGWQRKKKEYKCASEVWASISPTGETKKKCGEGRILGLGTRWRPWELHLRPPPSRFSGHFSVGCSHLVERPRDCFCLLLPAAIHLPISPNPLEHIISLDFLKLLCCNQKKLTEVAQEKTQGRFNIRIQKEFQESKGVSVSTWYVTNYPPKLSGLKQQRFI